MTWAEFSLSLETFDGIYNFTMCILCFLSAFALTAVLLIEGRMTIKDEMKRSEEKGN